MRSRRCILGAMAVALAGLTGPSQASAQDEGGPVRVAGLVSGSLGAGHSAPTVGLSGRYQLRPRLSVEGDLSHFSGLTLFVFGFPREDAGQISVRAQATSATANLVFELPGGVRWLRPYVAAGGGGARVRRELRGGDACPACRPTAYTKPVVSLGGGVDFLVWHQLAVGMDVRYQRVFEDERIYRPNLRNLKRIGSLVSYRF
jgi:opacity protein-like surface antigen